MEFLTSSLKGEFCLSLGIDYYTPLPLNLANKEASKQATSKQASNKQASTSPFRFGHCSASSLRVVLYSSHPKA